MALKLTGDDAALRAMIAKAKKIGGALTLKILSKRLGDEARRRAVDSFTTSTSPEGEAWAPLKHRKGKPLVKTGRLSRSIKVRASSKGFTLYSTAPYAVIHQRGASLKERMQARTRGGRFKSKKAADKQKRGAVRVGHIAASSIPARPFFPRDALPTSWRESLVGLTRDWFREYFE